MKIIIGIFCLIFVNLSFASWEDITPAIDGVIVYQKSKDTVLKKIELKPEHTLKINLKKSLSLMCSFDVDTACSCSVTKENILLKEKQLKAGNSNLKIFLEPGNYSIKISSRVTFRAFRWKMEKSDIISPDGGGIPVYLMKNGKQYNYNLINESTISVLKVKGPASVKMMTRIKMSEDKYRQQLNLIVKEHENVVTERKTKVTMSKITKLASDTTAILSEAYSTTLQVPHGLHKYTISFLDGSGVIKFFRLKQTATIHNPKNIRKIFGTFKVQ